MPFERRRAMFVKVYCHVPVFECLFVCPSVRQFHPFVCLPLPLPPSVRPSVCPSVRLSVCPSVSVHSFVRLPVCPSVRLSVCLRPFVRLSVCPSVRLPVSLLSPLPPGAPSSSQGPSADEFMTCLITTGAQCLRPTPLCAAGRVLSARDAGREGGGAPLTPGCPERLRGRHRTPSVGRDGREAGPGTFISLARTDGWFRTDLRSWGAGDTFPSRPVRRPPCDVVGLLQSLGFEED